ncbi:MAG: apolipoprotein N-acyltransferase [Clostridia bacterium]|nr:apolipoprotein N-acyltransferase [Clostridia bacterium]
MKNNVKKFCAALNRAIVSKRISLFLCLLAGALGALPYYVEELFIFTFVSLFAIFYIAIKQRNERNRFFAPFFWYFMGFYSPLYLFLSEMYPYSRFGFSEDQAVFVLICSCIAIPLLHALVSGTIMIIARAFNNKYDIIGYASLFVINEWVLSMGTLAFPWSGVAVSLTGCLPYLQTASLFGKYFITFITVAACFAFARATVVRKRYFAIVGATIISANLILGTVLWFIPYEKSEPIDATALQGNVLSNEKWDSANKGSIFDIYIDMTEKAAENGSSIIVLPETAIPSAFIPNGIIHKELARIATEYNVTIISGVHYYGNKNYYNAVVAILPDGSLSERYDKRHLVPFGEFIPFADFIGEMLPFVGEFNEGTNDLTEGTEPIVIETEFGGVAPLVCFDSIFPEFSREAVDNGAEIIAIVTNDSWFNDSVGIYTHLRHAQLRAIENRRYIMRAANTGVSAFIDERGNVISYTEPLTRDTADCEIYAIEGFTLYTMIGDVMINLSCAVILYFIAISIYNKTRRIKNGDYSTSQQ